MNAVLNNAKKIRNKLLYFIDTELRKNIKKNNILLIDSKTPEELNEKYQKFSDYCIDLIETYNGNQINYIISNNFFHVTVTYTSSNNDGKIYVENKNFDRVTSNNIAVGQYLNKKNSKLKSSYEPDVLRFNLNQKNYIDNKKRTIGDKKFTKKRRTLCSSIEMPNKAIIMMNENNIDSAHNQKILPRLDDDNKINNNETICTKKRILKSDYYENKLKKYCSNLILLKKKKNRKKFREKDPTSPKKNYPKKYKKNFTLKPNSNQRLGTPNPKKSKDRTEQTKQIVSIKSQHKNHKQKNKDKAPYLTRIIKKKSTYKRIRALSIKDNNIFLDERIFLKKNNSPKKQHFANYNKELTNQKLSRKEKDKNSNEKNEIKKIISGGIKSKRKIFAGKASLKKSNNNFPDTNKFNIVGNPPPVRKPLYKRSNTLNKVHNIFHFKGNELKSKEY